MYGYNLGYQIARQGSKLKFFESFDVEEGTTVVGTIKGSNFEITQGADDFTISEAGLIEFILAPDYETKNLYNLVINATGIIYEITVNVTDVASEYELLTATELLITTQF